MRCAFCGSFSAAGVQMPCDHQAPAAGLEIMSVDRQKIFSVEDWFETCPPKKRDAHWKDGYSAKEAAKSWFRHGEPRVPSELTALFSTALEFADLRIATVHPEIQTKLDDYQGGRNADLLLLGAAGKVPVAVSVEAKAGEQFGPVIGPYVQKAVTSKIPSRIEALSQAIFGRPVVSYDKEIVTLRYQLLHALAGAAIEAHDRGAARAAMVVHYFPNPRTSEEESFEDFELFVKAVGEPDQVVRPGQMVRVTLPGGARVPLQAEVWVGWASAPVAGA